ncbi:MAG: H+transporting two-sector ATPase C subunit [Gammaproteobacteria bacterium]|nr:ATP synthase subunit C [Gammaproteobacteria bacterium]NND35495.1 H+transporting two-sector ATPase C subunit [Gammaproteobacteria bacterium]
MTAKQGILVIGIVLAIVTLVVTTTALLVGAPVWAAEGASQAIVDPDVVRWGFAAGALSASLSALAAGYAVAQVGTAAVGVLAEKPEMLGRVLILVGLAEGIAIYGLIVAILIFNRIG